MLQAIRVVQGLQQLCRGILLAAYARCLLGLVARTSRCSSLDQQMHNAILQAEASFSDLHCAAMVAA